MLCSSCTGWHTYMYTNSFRACLSCALVSDWLTVWLVDWLIVWLVGWLVGGWMNDKMDEWLTGHYVCCGSREMYFPLHKMHGRRTVYPVTWIAKNSRTNKCHINHYKFKFHISFKRCRRKKRRWTTSHVRCPWKFHTTSFLSQIVLYYWGLNNVNTSSIAKLMYSLQKLQFFWRAYLVLLFN